MDVFVGGLGPDVSTVADRVGSLLAAVDAPHRPASLGSGLVHAWIDDASSELRHHRDDDLEVVFDGYLYGHGSPSLEAHLPVLGRRLLERGTVLEGDEGGIFSLVVHDRRSGRLLLAGDPSGLLPLHVTTGPGPVRFGSHLHLLADAIGAAPDLVGVAWMIRQKHLLGGRTTYAGIHRVCAGEVVEVRPDGTRSASYPEVYFSGQAEPSGDPADLLWDALLRCVDQHTGPGAVGTMLSEGFDSRLIAGILHAEDVELELFTHATPGTTGLGITRRIAATLGSRHVVDHLPSGYPADPLALRRQLLLADNLHVPMWIFGADHFRAIGVRAATTGYALDTTIGAHAFASNEGSKRSRALARYVEIVSQDAGRVDDRRIERTAEDVLGAIGRVDTEPLAARIRRFLAPAAAEEVVGCLDEVSADVRAELDRLRATGDDRPSQVLQRYFLENRVRRFSFGQELTLRSRVRVIVPSYEPAFMRTAAAIPPRLRLHHREYLRLMRRHLPELAKIPSGAHMLPLTAPRLALETGRFVGVAREARIDGKYLVTRGASGATRIRGVLYADETARNADRYAMEDVAQRAPSLNREWLELQATKIKDYQIRVYLPVVYQPVELAQIFDRSA